MTGTDIDEGMLAAADQFATEDDLEDAGLVKDDLFACEHEPGWFDLVHARYEICHCPTFTLLQCWGGCAA